jgi:hypothetical protein
MDASLLTSGRERIYLYFYPIGTDIFLSTLFSSAYVLFISPESKRPHIITYSHICIYILIFSNWKAKQVITVSKLNNNKHFPNLLII